MGVYNDMSGYDDSRAFSNDAAGFVCGFVEALTVPDARFAGKRLVLLPWQRDAISQFYGTLRDDGFRSYQYLYLEIPKKNGKSGLSSALALYHTFADGESNGEVYVCAADRDNAGIVFNSSVAMLNACPALKKRAKIVESQKIIRDTVSGTVYRVMSSEAYSKHGYKPSCVIFDELHAQPNRELWDIMTFGAGAAREQPVWIVLTTAGDDPDRNSIGWEVHEKARRLLALRERERMRAAGLPGSDVPGALAGGVNGAAFCHVDEGQTQFTAPISTEPDSRNSGFIRGDTGVFRAFEPNSGADTARSGRFEPDSHANMTDLHANMPESGTSRDTSACNRYMVEGDDLDAVIDNPAWLPRIYGYYGDDIFNESNWFAANPSLGTLIKLDTVRQEALTARESEGAERLFRWLRLNQWIATKTVGWLPLTLFDRTVGAWDASDLDGCTCYLGLDLSSTTDLTALAAAFPPQNGFDKWRVLYWGWIPEAAMKERERRDHVPFSAWVKNGWLLATPGDAVDYTAVEQTILEINSRYKVALLGTDQWNSRMLTQRLMSAGMDVLEIPQTIAGLSLAMKDIDKLLRDHSMEHDKNPAARWCFGNVRIAQDGNENIKPMKNKSIDRIDITVAWINAVAAARSKTGMDVSPYEGRAPRMIEW